MSSSPLPFTLTDVIRALREFMGLLDDVSDLSNAKRDSLKVKRSEAAAKEVAGLRFTPGGFMRALRTIRGGEGGKEQFDRISQHLADSEAKVTEIVARLKEFYDPVRERFGMDVANQLEDLVALGGERVANGQHAFAGKEVLRRRLRQLAELHSEADRDRAADLAKDILEEVAIFNGVLVKLHDRLVGLERSQTDADINPSHDRGGG